MKTLNDIAAAAYDAHGKELYRLIGVTQRPWTRLSFSEAMCWLAAVQQVRAEVAAAGVQVDAELAAPVSQSVLARPTGVYSMEHRQ